MKEMYPGGYCKFVPSCSQYGKLAIEKYGPVKGSAKAFYRVLRCNPWNKGGMEMP